MFPVYVTKQTVYEVLRDAVQLFWDQSRVNEGNIPLIMFLFLNTVF